MTALTKISKERYKNMNSNSVQLLCPSILLHSLFELWGLGVASDIFLNSRGTEKISPSFTVFGVVCQKIFLSGLPSGKNENKDVGFEKKKKKK